MADYRGFDLLELLIDLVKHKRFFIILGISTLILSYTTIYFFLPAQYDATALIVASDSNPLNPVSEISRSITKIPLSALGFGSTSSLESYDLFTTFIYSRTNLEGMINKFNLLKDYKLTEMDKAVKALSKSISVNVTEQRAFSVTIRAGSPEKASEMTNYVVDKVNRDVIQLNVKKSQDNVKFLKDRYFEIKSNLQVAEDSLKVFQSYSGILEPENQVKASIEEYAGLESELAKRQIELSVIERIYGKNSVQFNEATITTNEFQKKLNSIKNNPSKDNLLVSINHLPSVILKYARLYRDVKIYSAMLEFIIPLYEQARFEEVKNVPVLQVIDRAIPPEKKSYPPRTILTLLVTIFILLMTLIIRFLIFSFNKSDNPRILALKNELFHAKMKSKGEN